MNPFATHFRTLPTGKQTISWFSFVLTLAALAMLFASSAPAKAQLADQPWPTAAADNQNTSQSVTLGSVEPAVISSQGSIHSPIATGPNGNLYYKEYDGNALYLVSASLNGSESPNWRINLTAQGEIADGEEPSSVIVTEEYVYFLAPSENIGTGLFRVNLGGDALDARYRQPIWHGPGRRRLRRTSHRKQRAHVRPTTRRGHHLS